MAGRPGIAKTAQEWERIRAAYEAGMGFNEVLRNFPVSRAALYHRMRKENWTHCAVDKVNQLAREKALGLREKQDTKERGKAIEDAAELKAAVLRRHREEWRRQQVISDKSLETEDFDMARLAKISAEQLKIRQAGERIAWDIVTGSEELNGGLTITWQE